MNTSTLTLAYENRNFGGELGQVTAARLIDLDLIATLAAAVIHDVNNKDNMTALKEELASLGYEKKSQPTSDGDRQ